MATDKKQVEIPGRLHSVATEGVVAGANEILDDNKGKNQQEINASVDDSLQENKTNIANEITRATNAENAIKGGSSKSIQNLDSRLSTVEAHDTISMDGGSVVVGTAEDFTNRTTAGDAKIPTVGAILNAADEEPTAGSGKLVKSGGVASAFGYNKSQTQNATQGVNYYNYFTNINIKQGERFKVKATGDAITANINLYINNLQGTSLGNVNVNGSAVEIVAPSDISTLCCYKYSGYVTASGSLTIEVLIEGSVINKQLEPINATIENHTESISNLTNAYGKTVVKTQTATSGSNFNCTTNIAISSGHRFSVKVDTESGVFNNKVEVYKERVTTANRLVERYANMDAQEFVADGNITKIIVYASSSRIASGGTVTVTIRDYGSVLSEALDGDSAFVMNQEIALSSSTSQMLCQCTAEIKSGEYYIMKVIDADNALNGNAVEVYKGTSATAANRIDTFSGNNVSIVCKADADIAVITFYSKPPTGSAFNSGRVRCEVHKSQEKDALMNELYNMNQRIENAGSSSVIVDVVNPYWSESWQGNLVYADTPQLKGIYIKFDSITIHIGSERIVKTWSDLKTDLPSAIYGAAGDNMTDTLLLSIYSYANQILYYDLKARKFKIANDNTSIGGKYILLAYAKNGSIGGEICRQYNDRLTLNKNPYLTEPNAKYLDTLRVKEMELLEAKDFFTFGWMSDTHYSLREYDGTSINVTNAIMNDIDDYIGLDAIINTGDLILYGSKSKQQGMCALQKTFKDINVDKFIISVGNHDFNSVADSGQTVNKKDWIVTDSELETLFFRKIKTTARPDGRLYYYRDFDEKKVRIISLNTMDVPIIFNVDDTIKYDPVGVQGMSETQISWLANTALDLSSKGTDANNWKIIVAMHVPLYSNYGSAIENASIVKNILSAFVNRSSSATYTYTDSNHDGIFSVNLTLDFTDAKGKLVAVIAGHTHKDVYYNDAGFNFIQIQQSYNNNINMLPETYNEFAIDVVILDDVQEKIILKRFGNYSVSDNPNGDREYPYDVTT